jgi:hypothetical protein
MEAVSHNTNCKDQQELRTHFVLEYLIKKHQDDLHTRVVLYTEGKKKEKEKKKKKKKLSLR